MSLATPTTSELSDAIISQLAGSISQTIPLLPKSFSRVLAKTLAGVFVLLYKYAGFIFLQMFVAHATMSETAVNGRKIRPLVELGRMFGVSDPRAATRAELLVSVPVLDQTGSLPAFTQLLYDPTGVIYKTVAAVDLDGPTVQVRIRASSAQDGDGSGDIGNLEVGDVLAFANPPSKVGSEVTVVSQVVTGADAETPDEYRFRVMQRVQRRPQGGAYADYYDWAVEVEGISKAYIYTGDPGEVDVYCEATEASSGSADGIPTSAQLDAVFDNIELNEAGRATRRPANAAINVDAITRTSFDVEITGLDPDTADLRVSIEEGVDEYLRSREPYIVGLSVLPRADRIVESAIGGVVDPIVSAEGATVTSVEITPGPAYTLGRGEKAKLGTITFV